MDDSVTKPVERAVLLKTLDHWIGAGGSLPQDYGSPAGKRRTT